MLARRWNVVWLVLGLLLTVPASAELSGREPSGPQVAQRGPTPPDCEIFRDPACSSRWDGRNRPGEPGGKVTQPPPPITPTVENAVNRGGGDYAQFEVADPEACRAYCQQDPSCRAYTFVHANKGQGPTPRCWMKSVVPPPIADSCCISGVKQ